MSVFDKLLGSSIKETVKGISDAVSPFVTADKDKLAAKAQITTIVTQALNTLAMAQKELIGKEISGNSLQRNWRPIVMLAFAAIVVYSKFVAPCFGLPNTELEPDFWELLKIGIGGYVVGRSVEKVAERVTDNIDLSFARKKDRKL